LDDIGAGTTAGALEALARGETAGLMTDWVLTEPEDDAAGVATTGTTTLIPVVDRTTDAEPERTELALLSIDDSSDAALDAAAVTITPGAVSVTVMAMVSV